MILSHESEYERSWSGREGTDDVQRERSQKDCDEKGGKKEAWREDGEEKGLAGVDQSFKIHRMVADEEAYSKFAGTP